MNTFYYLLLISLFFHFNLSGQDQHDIAIVSGSTNNKLEVIDWGGKGQSILFLSGLGNSAHVYDDFAPRFTDKFHVYGLSRRGFGASEQTANGYGIDTLTKDIFAVTKALHMRKVILIGHSLAGDEITTFATTYPNEVEKVIYFDAAYDHSHVEELPYPDFPPIQKDDTTSIQNYNAYFKRIRGFTLPEDELRLIGNTPDMIITAIIKGLIQPNYKGIRCPALAIYGQRNTAEQWFPSYPYMDSTNQQKAVNEFMPSWKMYYAEELNRFKNEIPYGLIKEILGADHYVFLTNSDETEKIVREFINGSKK